MQARYRFVLNDRRRANVLFKGYTECRELREPKTRSAARKGRDPIRAIRAASHTPVLSVPRSRVAYERAIRGRNSGSGGVDSRTGGVQLCGPRTSGLPGDVAGADRMFRPQRLEAGGLGRGCRFVLGLRVRTVSEAIRANLKDQDLSTWVARRVRDHRVGASVCPSPLARGSRLLPGPSPFGTCGAQRRGLPC